VISNVSRMTSLAAFCCCLVLCVGCPTASVPNGDNGVTPVEDGSGSVDNPDVMPGENDNPDGSTDPVDGSNGDGMSDAGGESPDSDPGTGGSDGADGTGGGGGDSGGGDLPPPPVIESDPCTLTSVGDGTNPGVGEGLVTASVSLDSVDGSVVVRPVLPPPFDGNQFTITPESALETIVLGACSDEISLGIVTFIDADGVATSPGEVTFSSGVDFTCGQPLAIVFSPPCTVELQLGQ
jgi:hypothetical protein